MTEYQCPNKKCRKPTLDYGLHCPDCIKQGYGIYRNGKLIKE